MHDLEENEVQLSHNSYAGSPAVCPVCEKWQIDMVMVIPLPEDGFMAGLRAMGLAASFAAEMMSEWWGHMRQEHPDEPLLQGFQDGLSSD